MHCIESIFALQSGFACAMLQRWLAILLQADAACHVRITVLIYPREGDSNGDFRQCKIHVSSLYCVAVAVAVAVG